MPPPAAADAGRAVGGGGGVGGAAVLEEEAVTADGGPLPRHRRTGTADLAGHDILTHSVLSHSPTVLSLRGPLPPLPLRQREQRIGPQSSSSVLPSSSGSGSSEGQSSVLLEDR